LLRGLDSGSFVKVSFVVNIKSLEGIGQAKDLVLLKLRKFPMASLLAEQRSPQDPAQPTSEASKHSWRGNEGRSGEALLQKENVR
jgi:hypothetical protein